MGMGMPPSARRGGKRAPMAEINVTPLVDVMLVLLIIFMVTAPLLVSGVPVKLPDSRAKGLDTGQKPTVVSLQADGNLFINDAAVSEEELPATLAELATKSDKGEPPQIFLRADAALDYGRVMKVMGELNRAGLNKVALVSESAEAPAPAAAAGAQ